MLSWIKGLFLDEEKFKRSARGLALALAVGASTAGGAEALRDVGVDSKSGRAIITMLFGALAGITGVGTQKQT